METLYKEHNLTTLGVTAAHFLHRRKTPSFLRVRAHKVQSVFFLTIMARGQIFAFRLWFMIKSIYLIKYCQTFFEKIILSISKIIILKNKKLIHILFIFRTK